MKKIPVILDTDLGTDIDDSWAIAYMLKCPELDVKLITTATGDTTYRAKLCAGLLSAGEKDRRADRHRHPSRRGQRNPGLSTRTNLISRVTLAR